MIERLLEQCKTDGVLLIDSPNLRYYTGFTGGTGIAVLTRARRALLVDGRYTVQARQQTDFEVIEYAKSPYELLKGFGMRKVGFEDDTVTYKQYNLIRSALPEAELTGVSGVLGRMRQVKRAEEQDAIRTAERIGDLAFSHILRFIKPGVTESAIALELEYFMKKNGASGLSFHTIVAAGARAALPHADVTDRPVQSGELVLMDFGCVYHGYCSDMTRTVAVGQVSDEIRAVYDTVLRAQKAALAAVKAGVPCREVDAAARDIIRAADCGGQFNHALGHGVGLEIHEEPRLSPASEQTLQAGHIVTVEPGIYIEDVCGVRIEDLVLVTADGCENFTQSQKELIIL